jgi:hypothetical protein
MHMKKRLAITALALLVFGVWTTVGVMYLGNKSLAGQVVDAQIGSPVAGATVRLGALTAMTDQNGRYLFAGLQRLPDSQRLAVEVDGYYPQVQTVELAWWQRQAAVDVKLRPIQLTGVVLDAWTEQPLSDALVEVHQVGSALSNTQTVTTDGAGRFAFIRLAPPVSGLEFGHQRI